MIIRKNGFTLIELLVVVAILGILAVLIAGAAISSRQRAYDKSIQTSLGQIRWQAEIAYDSNGSSFVNWIDEPLIQDELTILLDDIDANLGEPQANCGTYSSCPADYNAVLRYSQEQEYCISAPKRSSESEYFCVDHEGTVTTSSSHCPDYDEDGEPLRCPTP